MQITGFVDDDEYGRWLGQASLAVQLRSISFGESSAAVNDAIAAGLTVLTSVASCVDIPPGVVHLIAPDASVPDMAAAIASLVNDHERSSAMRAAGQAYATSWGFPEVAERVAEVIRADALRR